jgi:RNA polymerase-binding transcription factor DksA
VEDTDTFDPDADEALAQQNEPSSLSEIGELDDGDLGVSDDDDSVLEEGRRLLADAEAKLLAVEQALARLDAGSYGVCEVCNEPIAPAVLSQRPSLARCAQHDETNAT